MSKSFKFMVMGIIFIMLTACGSTKQTLPYYERATEQGSVKGSTLRESNPVLRLAKEQGNSLRAAQSSTARIEDVALENAENAAAQALASRLESAIYGIRERFNQNNQIDDKNLTEEQTRNLIRTKIKQSISYKVIGEPAIYDNSDGTVTIWVCVELTKPTEQILNDAYKSLTDDEIIKMNYDRDQFVKDVKDELDQLINESK